MRKQKKAEEKTGVVIRVQRRTALMVCAVLAVTVSLTIVACGLAARSDSAPVSSGKTSNAAAPPVANVRPQGMMDEVRIHVGSNGFEPVEISHAAGKFSIVVENASGVSELILQLKAGDGTVLREIRVEKGSPVWGVDLQAGQYTLTEANHPSWVCHITIQ